MVKTIVAGVRNFGMDLQNKHITSALLMFLTIASAKVLDHSLCKSHEIRGKQLRQVPFL